MFRRAFMKMAGVAGLAAAAPITLYSQPLVRVTNSHEWIEDRGDFYIVRVPDGKTFAEEALEKPTIIQMGARSKIRRIWIEGFTNVYAAGEFSIEASSFDARGMATSARRPVLHLNGRGGSVTGCMFNADGWTPAMEIQGDVTLGGSWFGMRFGSREAGGAGDAR